MNALEAQSKQKRIEDLTLREIDMVYSLMRVQDWPDSEIGLTCPQIPHTS
jgi:hypothetical protein